MRRAVTLAQVLSIASALAGILLMVGDHFKGENASIGLLIFTFGVAGFFFVRWLRRECQIN